ncbi:MAG: lipocalin-like domain-containing protein [Acidobacteria bacterium]|nr:lipocalin-like domain-containing protein [Acidobacteriota bacterium]
MIHKALLASLVILCSLACRPVPSAENGLLGVWQIQLIENTTSSGSSTNSNPQPSLAIFTRSHYSLIWMPGATGMRAFKQRWLPTDEEMIQRYGEIVVNSGTYTQTESTITTRPVVSRFPEFMGGTLLYEYRVEGDTLWLTLLDEYSYDGIQNPWAAAGDRQTLTLTRVEDLER